MKLVLEDILKCNVEEKNIFKLKDKVQIFTCRYLAYLLTLTSMILASITSFISSTFSSSFSKVELYYLKAPLFVLDFVSGGGSSKTSTMLKSRRCNPHIYL